MAASIKANNKFGGENMKTNEEEIEWVRLFKREAETLLMFQVPIGRNYYPEVLGIKFQPKNLKYEGWVYYADKKDLIQEYLTIKEEYEKDPKFLLRLTEKTEEEGEKLVRKSLKLATNLKDKSNKELKEGFEEFNEMFTKYMPFIWVVFSIERLLSEVIKQKLKVFYSTASDKVIGEYFNLLTSLPYKESTPVKERRKILEVAALWKKDEKTMTSEIDKKIKEIYEEYSWVGAMRVGWTYLKEPYDLKHYEGLVKALAEGNPEGERQEISRTGKELREKYNEFISKEKIDLDLIKIADLLRRYIFLRTYRGEVIVKSMVNIKPLLNQIASRFNLTQEDIVYFIPDEVMKLLESGEMPDYKPRKIGFIIMILDGKPRLISGVKPPEIKYKEISELKGEGIFAGVVKGRVKIINKKEDIEKFVKGDILVTQMTSPDMMPAIVKASAIITDEGGLTCHAALISRELKIPCIIATEIATKVLKDEELVEVDSKEGVVRRVDVNENQV